MLHNSILSCSSDLLRSEIPDINGERIPLEVNAGQIAWSARGIETHVMSGRSEQISISGGIESTYACYSCCTFSFYAGWISPDSATISVGGGANFVAWEQYQTCNNQVFNPQPASDFPLWISWNNAVASADGGYANGNSPGNTTIQASWWTDETVGYEVCEPYAQQVVRTASVTVTPPTVQVTEVGFTGDHQITRWSDHAVIDNPDGSAPTWTSTGTNHPVAYTKGITLTLFAKLTISPSIPNTSATIRIKNGSTVFATKAITLSGSTMTVSGIVTSSALETTVKTTTPTFTWEISYDGGYNWFSMGNTGPHTMYWTYGTPLANPFKDESGANYPPLYDFALEKACGFSNGASTVSTIITAINSGGPTTGVDTINYNPGQDIPIDHPLNAFTYPGGVQCSDLVNLLRGLLRSIGIDGTKKYIWAGPDSSTITRYIRGSTLQTNLSFRIVRDQTDDAPQNPHFLFHAVLDANSKWYDPSYGTEYASFSFDETAFGNTPQIVSTAKWSSDPFNFATAYVCGH